MACITYGMYNKHMACIAYGMYRTWHNQTYYSTGDGHFSPIGAYHAENDLVLILDVARFKWAKMKQNHNHVGSIQ
jgi:hypothetical protein